MPVILALLGALMSGLFMWVVWGNGMEVIHQWLDGFSARKKSQQNVLAALEARDRAARAPLKAITDPREAAMVLLSRLALERGEITAEQNIALSRIALERLGMGGKAEHHTTLAAFLAKSAPNAEMVTMELLPLFTERLNDEEKADLAALMDEVAALHGGPTEAQEKLIERVKKQLALA